MAFRFIVCCEYESLLQVCYDTLILHLIKLVEYKLILDKLYWITNNDIFSYARFFQKEDTKLVRANIYLIHFVHSINLPNLIMPHGLVL